MESAPPSYQAATLKDAWELVAPFMTTDELYQASLVSRRWHSIFTARLWGKPTSHFGIEYNGVSDHLARFQQSLETTRYQVRCYTYCLHLTSHQAVYFDDRPADWLQHILDRLPNLQSLVVAGVSFFDHAACQALQARPASSSIVGKGGIRSTTASSYGLRLLNASRCNNITATGLVTALQQFPLLIYLDLSYVRSARSTTVLASLKNLLTLKILKLKHIQLRDEEMPLLCDSIAHRVLCLDLSYNNITERSIDLLCRYCFTDGAETLSPDFNTLCNRDFDRTIYTAFTEGAVNQLTIETASEVGVAQLLLSGNDLSRAALFELLSKRSLRVLDMERLSMASTNTPRSMLQSDSRLTYLRIDHTALLGEEGLKLRPALIPDLHVLVLTQIPTTSRSDVVASSLVDLVKDYSRRAARSDTIVLEMVQPQQMAPTATSWHGSGDSSLTETRDSQAMWSAASTDFSFFRGEDTTDDQSRLSQHTFIQPHIDNLTLLSAYRKERQIAYDRSGGQATVEGYWPGTIRVER